MTLQGFVKFIFKSSDDNFRYNPSFNTLLPDQSITVESSCAELSIHQYFELFKRFLFSVGFDEHQVMKGATELTFNEYTSQEVMKKIAEEYDLIMAEDLPDLIEERMKQEKEWIEETNESWEKRYWEYKKNTEKEILDLKAKISRLENPDAEQYTDYEMDAMEHAAEEQNKHKLLKTLQNATTVCHDCGTKYGTYRGGCTTTWMGKCNVCGNEKPVKDTRDFGFMRKGIDELLNHD